MPVSKDLVQCPNYANVEVCLTCNYHNSYLGTIEFKFIKIKYIFFFAYASVCTCSILRLRSPGKNEIQVLIIY